jgi:putative MATE family efflux protein
MTVENEQIQYDKMTKTPVNRLVLTLGLPTTISMLVTNIYNMADTYFVSSLGTSASGATGVVFGLMAIIQAFGFMLGHGAGSNISRLLGGRHIENARKFSAISFYLSLFCGMMILVLGKLFQVPLMRLLGSTDSILPYAKEYSTYILIAAPAMASGCVMNNILRYEGKAAYAMIGLTSGGLLNIAGDYILIRICNMGIAGAGISTAVSQYISAGILLVPYLTGKVQSSFAWKYMACDREAIWKIVTVGLPSMMRQGLNSISVMMLNRCAAVYGDAAIAALSIVSRVINFMFCVGLGIGQGFQPVSAFNYGAKKYSRVKEAFRVTLIDSFVMLTIMSAFGAIFADSVIAIFRDDQKVIEIGTFALRMQCIALILMPISVMGNMLFQSIGKSGRATFLSSIRSGVAFIPILLLFSRMWGILGIQLAQPVADAFSALITIPFLSEFFKRLPEDS